MTKPHDNGDLIQKSLTDLPRLYATATKGPWSHRPELSRPVHQFVYAADHFMVADCGGIIHRDNAIAEANAEFVAAAYNAMPALLSSADIDGRLRLIVPKICQFLGMAGQLELARELTRLLVKD